MEDWRFEPFTGYASLQDVSMAGHDKRCERRLIRGMPGLSSCLPAMSGPAFSSFARSYAADATELMR